LCSDRLRWLEDMLAGAPDRPSLIIMHHPPFVTGIARMDQAGLSGIAPFAAVVQRYSQIERILCGHLHRAIESRFAGTVAGTAPSPAGGAAPSPESAWRSSAFSLRPARPPRRSGTSVCRDAPRREPSAGSCACAQAG